jgi:hypothetical protein
MRTSLQGSNVLPKLVLQKHNNRFSKIANQIWVRKAHILVTPQFMSTGYFLPLAAQLCLKQTYSAALQAGGILFSDEDSPFISVVRTPVAAIQSNACVSCQVRANRIA